MPAKARKKKTGKDANGSGSLWPYTLADGRQMWAVQLSVVDPATGARRRTTKRGFTTQADAVAWRSENSVRATRGTFVKPTALTVGEYIEAWLDTLSVRASTRAGYRTKIARHIKPSIGAKRLDRITRATLESFYRDLLDHGRTDHREGEGLSVTTVRQVHAILSGAFSEAERDGLIAANPCRHARVPARKAGDQLAHEVSPWSTTDVRRFLDVSGSERYGVLWRFLATTGVRRGEALGLRWTDLHLDGEHPRASIRRAVTVSSDGEGSKPVEFTPTKSGKARSVDLDARTVEALRSHRERQDAERLQAGGQWVDAPGGRLVFPRDAWRLPAGQKAGGTLHPERCSRFFQSRVKAHDLPKVRLHDLRHGWATMALQAGVHPKVVQERLGHATITVTLGTYSHVIEGQQRSAAETVAAMLD